MLISVGGNDQLDQSLGGVTRLTKYLFLLEKEGGVQAEGDAFRFEPYKAGPFSAKLYDDLEFLENLGLLESRVTGSATEEEAAEVERLNIDDLFHDPATDTETSQSGDVYADAFEEREFSLTEEGMNHIQKLTADPEYRPVVDAVRRVKSRFANHSLSDLLRYVYNKYPEMATESEIRDKVMRRGRFG
jgi:uncharacterized protein YwgA